MTMQFERCLRASLLVLIGWALPGCGGGDAPEIGLVTGTVTLDGQPLPKVEVAFHPTEGRPAFAKTDAQGKYSLTYMPDKPGCKVGTNRVTIGSAEDEGGEFEIGDEGVAPGSAANSAPPLIPARYNTDSELTADVKAGDNVFDFPLTSK